MSKANEGIAPVGYRPRTVDARIAQYLRLFGAVEIAGTKWCGKTWSALAHANSVTYVDRGANLQIATADPAYVLGGEAPHVIDEWQRVPAIWDTVRHAVDEGAGRKGRWLLTGSSTPLMPGERGHSGAGRIGRIRMYPMSLSESGDSADIVSLAALFEGQGAQGQCPDGIADLCDLVCRGGWPEEIENPEDAQIIVREYLRLIFEESVPRFGGDPLVARRTAMSIARNLGQAPTNKTVAKDVFALADDTEPTDQQMREVSKHIDILERLYLVNGIPGWVPASRSPQRMRTKAKLYFADPSLAVALLGASPEALLGDWQTFGLVFENLVMRDLLVYAGALADAGDASVRYYRDDSGLEVDVVIEQADGSWGAIEVKLSQEKVDEAAKNLLRLERKLGENDRARTVPPAFLAIVTGMGEAPYRRADGVHVVPLRALCP